MHAAVQVLLAAVTGAGLLFGAAMLVSGFALPLLSFGGAAAALLVWYVWERPAQRRWDRRLEGYCGRCGYDLKANVSGVCPECGRSVMA
jgi:hypothetical protein